VSTDDAGAAGEVVRPGSDDRSAPASLPDCPAAGVAINATEAPAMNAAAKRGSPSRRT